VTDGTIVVSDDSRCPMTAQRQKDGGVALRGLFRNLVLLSRSEIDRLAEFAHRDEPPRLGSLACFPAKTAAPPTDELNWLE
jgi:hypothetical protein